MKVEGEGWRREIMGKHSEHNVQTHPQLSKNRK